MLMRLLNPVRYALVWAVIAACIPLPAKADAITISNTVSETQILQAAMRYSPDFQSVIRDAVIDKADADQISRLDNPTLEFNGTRNSAPNDSSNNYEFEFEQPLKLSQLTGARARLSNTLFKHAEIKQQHGIIQAYWSVKMLYAQAWQAQELAKLYTDFQNQARQANTKISQSVRAGQTAISEGSLFSGDVAKFASDLEKIKAQESGLRLQLEQATGIDLNGKILAKPSLQKINPTVADLENQAHQNASLVRLLESDLKAATQQKQVALSDSIGPEIAPRLMYGRNPRQNEDSIGVGVVLTIPLWDRNQSERRKTEAMAHYAQRQLDTLQTIPLGKRLEQLTRNIQRLDRRIHTLESDALPNYRKGFAQAQKSFNAGQTSTATLWQIRERLFDTEQDALNATLESIESRRILSLETGTLPDESILQTKPF